jgi:hypothetical protein
MLFSGTLYRVLAAVIFALPVCAMAQSNDLLNRAKSLIDTRKATEALALLEPRTEALSGNPDFDYLLGMAALDAGRPGIAVLALERVLMVRPDHAQARAEIARAYFELGETRTAQAEFESLKRGGVPTEVAASIDKYLDAIGKRLAGGPVWRGYIEATAGTDSNINNATGSGFYSSGGLNFSANQGFHYAIGVPSPTLPATGTATYAVRAATSPTVADGSKSPGTATGSLAVQWGGTSTKVGLHLSVTMPGDTTYQVLSTGGTANPASTEIVVGTGGLWSGFNLLTTGSGYSCSGTCNTSVRGFFAGSAQEGAGLSYRLGTNATSKAIDGAMSFQPGTISTVSSLTLPSTGGVGPLGSAPDRIFTAQAGSVGGAGPGFFTNATFNTSNALTGFTTFTGGNTNGTASVSDFGGNSFVAWGRWNNGTPTQTSSLGTPIATNAIAANAGFHYLLGVPATTIPASGTATYSLLGASAPTISDGSIAPGSFAGSLAVNFAGASTRVALNATVTMGADNYLIATSGGLANPSTSQIAMTSSGSAANKTTWAGASAFLIQVPVTGVTSCAGCQATIQGSFFGANLEAAGINYSIGGVAGGLKSIQGSAAFARNAPPI